MTKVWVSIKSIFKEFREKYNTPEHITNEDIINNNWFKLNTGQKIV